MKQITSVNVQIDRTGLTSDVKDLIEEQIQLPINKKKQGELRAWAQKIGIGEGMMKKPCELVNGSTFLSCVLAFVPGAGEDEDMTTIGTLTLQEKNGDKRGSCTLKVGMPAREQTPYLGFDFSPTAFFGLGLNHVREEATSCIIDGTTVALDGTMGGYVFAMCEIFSRFSGISIDAKASKINMVNVTSYVALGEEVTANRVLGYFRGLGTASFDGIDTKRTEYYLQDLGLEYYHPTKATDNHAVKFRCKGYINGNSDSQYASIDMYIKGYQIEGKVEKWIAEELKNYIRLGIDLYLNKCIRYGMLLGVNGREASVRNLLASKDPISWTVISEEYNRIAEALYTYGGMTTLWQEMEVLVDTHYSKYTFQRAIREWLLSVSNFRLLYGEIYTEKGLPEKLTAILETLTPSEAKLAEASIRQWLRHDEIKLEGKSNSKSNVFKAWRSVMHFDPRHFSLHSYNSLRKAQNKSCMSRDTWDKFIEGKITAKEITSMNKEIQEAPRKFLRDHVREPMNRISNNLVLRKQ